MTQKETYSIRKAINNFYRLLNLERREISNVYFYAIISGFILLSLPLGIQAITNLMFGGTLSTSLVVLIAIVVTGVLINGLLQVKQMRATEKIQQRIFTRLTFAYAYRIPKIDLSSIDNYYLPELVNRFFDTSNLQKGLSKLLLDFPTASIQVLFGLILLCFYHPVFIAFALILTTLIVLIFYFTSPAGFRTSMKESDYKYDVAHWLEEMSRCMKTFKFNQSGELHLKKTDTLVTGYIESRNSHFSVLLFQYRVLIIFKVLTTASMLIIGSVLVVKEQINLGQFVAAEIVIITILNSIEKLIVSLEVIYDVLTSLEKLNKLLDKPQDKEIGAKDTVGPFLTDRGVDIKIAGLSFGYPGREPVLKSLNLNLAAGDKVWISGSEGSGKTTLLRILTGIYSDFTGNILLNDVPLNLIPKEKIHRSVSILMADEELFSGTILENITIGNEDVDYSHLKTVCNIVGLQDYISKQQHGLETLLDPQGRKLPSNIKHKILLARCMVMKPALMLVEDVWRGIEPVVRENVINYLTSADSNFTMIAISNDEDFGTRCNRQLIIENGSLIKENYNVS